MNYTLQRILKSIREAQAAESTKLSKQQMVAVLQGITGFSSAIFTSKTPEEPQGPFAYIETALVIIDYDTNKQCRAALDSVVKSAEKWLTFGKYRPLEDSSDLNFDLIDVSSVTDIMQVWFMVLNSFARLHCYKFVPLSLLYYSSFLLPFSFSLSLSPWRTWFSSKLSGVLWRWGGKRKESLQVRLWNLNICIKKVDAKCWLAEMTLVVTSLTLARGFQCPFTFALVSASRWLAEIWQLCRREATGELEVEFKFQRHSCKLSFLFPLRRR